MPIPNVTLTGAQFDYLQKNISSQSDEYNNVSSVALSGLQYVVDLQVAAPEVDLVNPFANQVGNVEATVSDSNFITITSSLNMHAIVRGTTQQPGETFTDRLNRWLGLNNFGSVYFITKTYARISSGAGFVIDGSYIEP